MRTEYVEVLADGVGAGAPAWPGEADRETAELEPADLEAPGLATPPCAQAETAARAESIRASQT
jgi:hypothetical protein